eukprot:808717_1
MLSKKMHKRLDTHSSKLDKKLKRQTRDHEVELEHNRKLEVELDKLSDQQHQDHEWCERQFDFLSQNQVPSTMRAQKNVEFITEKQHIMEDQVRQLKHRLTEALKIWNGSKLPDSYGDSRHKSPRVQRNSSPFKSEKRDTDRRHKSFNDSQLSHVSNNSESGDQEQMFVDSLLRVNSPITHKSRHHSRS